MSPGTKIIRGVVALGLLVAVWLAPTPHQDAADRQLADLEETVSELAWELSVAEGRLADTQQALVDEAATRQVLGDDLDRVVADIETTQAIQYATVVEAFRRAADVACGPVEPEGSDESDDAALSELATRAASCSAASLTVMADELAAVPLVCGVLPVEAVTRQAAIDQCVVLYAHTDEVATATLPVTDWAGKGITDVLATSVSVDPGDTLDVSGYFQVTNELSATVGVGAHLWAYNPDAADSAKRIGPATGDNVDRSRHHMPISLQTVYVVPDDWPPGDEMTIVLRADAHSTRAKGNVGLDPNGNLIVRITRG